MTILAAFSYRRLIWGGGDDPRLPTGVWVGNGTVVGDASGGAQFVRINFGNEGDPISGEYFNLEQFSTLISEGTSRDMFLRTVNMTPGPQDMFDRIWHYRVETLPGLGGNSGFGDIHPKLPLFLGARLRDAEAPGTLEFGTTNLTATTSITVSAMGYIWDARSVLVPGGLERPERSLFGG